MKTEPFASSKFKIWFGLLAIINLFTGVLFRNDLAVSDVGPIVSILQNTSAMIFAISGIWIAYLYPQAVAGLITHRITENLSDKSDDEIERIKLIVGVIVLSGLVMASIIILTTISPLIGATEFYIKSSSLFNSVGLLFLLSLVEIQLFCIYVVLASSVSFINDLNDRKQKNALKKKFGVTHPLRPKDKKSEE